MDPIVEVVALVLAFLGWVLAGVCLPNRYWKVSTIDGTVITTSTIYENLWMSCATDSTGVHNCREFPSLLALNGTSQKNYKKNKQNKGPPPARTSQFSSAQVEGARLISLHVARLHPSVSCVDDRRHCDGLLRTGGCLDWSTVFQSRRGQRSPERENCWHCWGHVHTSR